MAQLLEGPVVVDERFAAAGEDVAYGAHQDGVIARGVASVHVTVQDRERALDGREEAGVVTVSSARNLSAPVVAKRVARARCSWPSRLTAKPRQSMKAS